MSELKAHSLTVNFGAYRALDNVSVSLAPGKLIGLIGPNGAGKTTLIRALAGVQSMASGLVSWEGENIDVLDRKRLAQDIAYLPQGGVCHWPLTVERLIALGRLPHQSPWQKRTEKDNRAIARAMAEADIATLSERTVTTLSGGERMRALLARALATEPQMLLADEPVASLDPYHQLHVMDLLKAMTRRGAGVVVVLHDLTLAARYCDRLVLLAAGRVVGDGPVDAVLTESNLADSYRVAALRGEENGEAYVVPWKHLDSPTAGESSPEESSS